jgi:signal transduction histidine kinase
LPFIASVGSFVFAAAVLAVAEPHVPVVILGLAYILGIVVIAHFWGIAFSVPMSVASVVALDWYAIPPTHSFAVPSLENAAALAAYIVTGVLLGQVAAHARSRADVSELARSALADEQAALRRVATLVARQPPPRAVFAAVAEEVGRLLDTDFTGMLRYETDGQATVVAIWSRSGFPVSVGTRVTLEGENIAASVLRTQRPARIENFDEATGAVADLLRGLGVRSAAGSPIVVEGRLWGVMIAASTQQTRLPATTTSRIGEFTELVETAISNAETKAELTASRSRLVATGAELARLAEEQSALRRVATMVARATSLANVVESVSEEVGRLIPADTAAVGRYESDGTGTVLGGWSNAGAHNSPVDTLFNLEHAPMSTRVFATALPGRIDSYEGVGGEIAAEARQAGWRSAVATPITVEGRLWGFLSVASKSDGPFPADTEERLAKFTGLLATAIANAEIRAELVASRARIAAAADETRKRIERDLHDGTQQRLVSVGLELRAARMTVPAQLTELDCALSRVSDGLKGVFDELREISHGIHPPSLSEGGLKSALKALRRGSAVPVELDLHAERRLPERIEVATYYVVSEALSNVAKHAKASVVNVELDTRGTMLNLAIRDDGIGGADISHGSGLVGLRDRVEAVGGTLQIASPAGSGTTLLIEIPLEDHNSAGKPAP